MKTVMGRDALSVCAAAVLLTGCGGRQLPIAAPAAVATVAVNVRPAWRLHGLYSFVGGHNDGENPGSGVALTHAKGYPQIIGTTIQGGYYGAGTIYGLTKSGKTWTERLLYQFSGADGWEPMGIAVPRTLDQTTPVLVTSFRGGANGDGAFTALQPNASGTWTALSTYSFAGKPDGSGPMGPVIEDANGDLYGTTCCGGVYGFGTVYRIRHTASGYAESVLYSFQGGSDGDYPRGGLIDVGGALYGATEDGGGSRQYGTVFKLTPSTSGYKESVVYAFRGPPDGVQPYSGLCVGPGGTLYGTTVLGGAYNEGTVFTLSSVSSHHAESVIWSFGAFLGDGNNPWGPVIVDKRGVIYGTTINFSVNYGTSDGTFFTLTPKGSGYNENLYDFNGKNGSAPESGPTADGKGNIYMATYGGGPYFYGVVSKAKGAEGGTDCDPGSVTESD